MQEFEKNQPRPQEDEVEILVTRPAPAPAEASEKPAPVAREGASRAVRAPSATRPHAVRRVGEKSVAPAKTVKANSAPVSPAGAKPSPTPAAKPVATPVAKPVAKPASKPVAAPAAKPAPKPDASRPTQDTASLSGLLSKEEKAAVDAREAKKQKKKKADSRPVEVQDRGGVVVSVIKALVYIAFVLVVSGFLAVYGIRVANDIFAFVKDDVTVEVTIGEDATLQEVAEILCEEGLIEDAKWFELYTGYRYRDRTLEFVGGTYTLNSTMNYNTLISSLMPKSGREIVSILIPEGYNVDQIIDLLVSEGIGTREGYVQAIQNYDYNYEFLDVLDSIETKSGRRYRLEGYLFPAKYDIYRDSSEIAVIDKMLAAFQANFTDTYSDRLTELDMNMDEVITLASIIQSEARYSSDMYYISGVFHNRLNNAGTFPTLDSDATVLYALIDEAVPKEDLGKESPYAEKYEHKADLTKEDLKVNNPYNTYRNKGLTPGAICNPGLEAITAALYPEDKLLEERGVKSYYFVAGVDGYSLFGANEGEHDANISKVAADKAAMEAES